MKARYFVPLFALAGSVLLEGCSDSGNSSAPESSSSVAESSSSVSEFAPITFERLDASVGVKLTLAGDVMIDADYSKVGDASTSKIDSIQFTAKLIEKGETSNTIFKKDVEFDAPALNVSLNAVSIDIEEIEKCGKLRGYVWAFASGAEHVAYSAVDSLDFEIPESFCAEDEPLSSSSAEPVITECTEMASGELTVSTLADGDGAFVNLKDGSVSAAAEGMQIKLVTDGEYPELVAFADGYEVGEADVGYKAGVMPEKVCEEEVKSFADTRGESVEIVTNGWFTLESEDESYLIMVGKIAESEGNASVQLTYWKQK